MMWCTDSVAPCMKTATTQMYIVETSLESDKPTYTHVCSYWRCRLLIRAQLTNEIVIDSPPLFINKY